MKLIVGLGNPGPKYAGHRHNVGYQCVDEFARQHSLAFTHRQGEAIIATGQVNGIPVLLAKPQTYMNRSGTAVAYLVNYYKVSLSDLLVIYDDLDLPLGKIRIRPGGGSGGHRGVQSIIDSLGQSAFPRLRVGIGRPAPGVTDEEAIRRYVLQNFTPEEQQIMKQVRQRVAEAILSFIVEGLQRAMNKYNVNNGI